MLCQCTNRLIDSKSKRNQQKGPLSISLSCWLRFPAAVGRLKLPALIFPSNIFHLPSNNNPSNSHSKTSKTTNKTPQQRSRLGTGAACVTFSAITSCGGASLEPIVSLHATHLRDKRRLCHLQEANKTSRKVSPTNKKGAVYLSRADTPLSSSHGSILSRLTLSVLPEKAIRVEGCCVLPLCRK